MPTKDRSWFERKVRELGDVLRRLPPSRRRAFTDATDAGEERDPRQGTGGPLDDAAGESGSGAKKGE